MGGRKGRCFRPCPGRSRVPRTEQSRSLLSKYERDEFPVNRCNHHEWTGSGMQIMSEGKDVAPPPIPGTSVAAGRDHSTTWNAAGINLRLPAFLSRRCRANLGVVRGLPTPPGSTTTRSAGTTAGCSRRRGTRGLRRSVCLGPRRKSGESLQQGSIAMVERALSARSSISSTALTGSSSQAFCASAPPCRSTTISLGTPPALTRRMYRNDGQPRADHGP